MASIGIPIVGDAKYGGADAFLTGGISRKLHLHARRIRIDAPDGGKIDVSADLPQHFSESLTMLGFDPLAGDSLPLERTGGVCRRESSAKWRPRPRRAGANDAASGARADRRGKRSGGEPAGDFRLRRHARRQRRADLCRAQDVPRAEWHPCSSADRLQARHRPQPHRSHGGAVAGRDAQSVICYWLTTIGAHSRTYERSGEVEEPLFDGVLDLLDALEAEGWLLAVATGKSDRGLKHCLDRHGIHARFVSLQTADRHPSKPHPSMVEQAIADAGASAETTIVVGDTSFDMAMAANAGATGIGAGWGYHEPQELIDAGAIAVAGAPLDVLTLIRSHVDG